MHVHVHAQVCLHVHVHVSHYQAHTLQVLPQPQWEDVSAHTSTEIQGFCSSYPPHGPFLSLTVSRELLFCVCLAEKLFPVLALPLNIFEPYYALVELRWPAHAVQPAVHPLVVVTQQAGVI